MSQAHDPIDANHPALAGTSPYTLLTREELSQWQVAELFPAGMTDVRLPTVVGLSDGGTLRLAHPACTLYRFSDAIQHPHSTVIRLGDRAVFAKLDRLAANKELFQDRDLAAFNPRTVYLRQPEQVVRVGTAFSLLGVHASHWAHFLVQYLPKLSLAASQIEAAGTVVMQREADAHIKTIVRACLPEQVDIVEVAMDECVHFDRLLTCSEAAYLCDDATYTSIADIVIPAPTRRAVREILAALTDVVMADRDPAPMHRLYVAFDGQRGPVNGPELERYFAHRGYRVVRPHQLSLYEKIDLFARAERVVGVGSSGMTNVLFGQRTTRLLSFMNYERALDPLLSQFAEEYPNLELHFLVGRRVGEQGINSRYFVDLQQLDAFLPSHGF
jgi:hypothetical protein